MLLAGAATALYSLHTQAHTHYTHPHTLHYIHPHDTHITHTRIHAGVAFDDGTSSLRRRLPEGWRLTAMLWQMRGDHYDTVSLTVGRPALRCRASSSLAARARASIKSSCSCWLILHTEGRKKWTRLFINKGNWQHSKNVAQIPRDITKETWITYALCVYPKMMSNRNPQNPKLGMIFRNMAANESPPFTKLLWQLTWSLTAEHEMMPRWTVLCSSGLPVTESASL